MAELIDMADPEDQATGKAEIHQGGRECDTASSSAGTIIKIEPLSLHRHHQLGLQPEADIFAEIELYATVNARCKKPV